MAATIQKAATRFHAFSPRHLTSDICSKCGGLRITPDHGFDMAEEASKQIMLTIADLANKTFGNVKISNRYLPEVCALVSANKARLIKADADGILVRSYGQ